MVTLLLVFAAGLFMIPSAIGLFVIYHVFIRSKKSPADSSNRINHVRLFWFCLTREDQVAEKLEWMKNDEWDNVS